MTDVQVVCKYCGKKDHYLFTPDNELQSFHDALESDYEYLCKGCGSGVRLNEAVDDVVKKNHSYSVEADHADIKKQIKEWERILDHIILALYVDEPLNKEQQFKIAEHLEIISNEMMAINI